MTHPPVPATAPSEPGGLCPEPESERLAPELRPLPEPRHSYCADHTLCHTCDKAGQRGTLANTSDLTSPGTPVPTSPAAPETWDNTGQSETLADKPGRIQDKPPPENSPLHASAPPALVPNHRPPTPTLLPCDICVESVIFDDASDRNRDEQPGHVARLRSLNPHPPIPVTPDAREMCVESETFADSPAHVPASDVQLLTPNSQLLASTSTPPRTCDNTGQSETFADSPAHLPASDVQLLTSNSHLLASTSIPRSPKHGTIRDKVRHSKTNPHIKSTLHPFPPAPCNTTATHQAQRVRSGLPPQAFVERDTLPRGWKPPSKRRMLSGP